MYENIPAELRALPQWVAAGPDKVPIDPRTRQCADPSNPATGGTFAEAVHAGMEHIGFILGKNDPYTVIDLDDPFERNVKGVKSKILPADADYPEAVARSDRHTKIYNNFNTYAELSQSGTGVHLVMRGAIPCGVRRDKVEIYSSERYIIFTGNVLRNAPVTDCQPLLDGMFSQMGKLTDEAGELIEEEPILEDAKICDMATRASNAEKFISLCEGRWEGMGYPSQSEADYALLSMLAFYTRSNEQVRRMFRKTNLGTRDKATHNDVYINRSLRRIRSREAPRVDISAITGVSAPATPKAGERQQSSYPNDAILAPAILTDEALASLTIPPRESLLGDWFKAGDYGIIFGRRGLGKSWFAMGIARALAEGREFGPWQCATARRVLYVDGEMSLDDYQKRVQLLSEGPGNMLTLSHQTVFDQTEKALCLSDINQQDELTRLCEREDVNVLILDNSACLFRGVAENDADDFRDKIESWLLNLRRRSISVILVLHAGRNGAIRGTSKREDAAFWILRLDDAGEPEGGQGARFITRFVKNRNASQDPPPLDWHFKPNGSKTLITYTKADSIAVFRQWVEDGLDTCSEIAEEMNLSKGAISKMAKQAEREGWLKISGRKYTINKP